MRHDHLDHIIGAIYDAAASDPSNNEAWEKVARLIESQTGGVCMLTLENASDVYFVVAPSLASPFRVAYRDRRGGECPWVRALRGQNFPSSVTDADASRLFAYDTHLTETPFYREWMLPQRLHHTIASDVMRDDDAMLVLKTLFPPETPPTSAHLDLHTRLQPHLHRAARLLRLHQHQAATLTAAEAAMESVSIATFLVDCRTARVTFMNPMAARLTASSDGLEVDDNGRLTCPSSPWVTNQLRSMVREGAALAPAISVPRTSGAPDLHCIVIPSDAPHDLPFCPPTAAVFATDPSCPPRISRKRLCRLHGLTMAEARVVAALSQGISVTDMAETLGVAAATARHHLKQAFIKTGTHRQADLVRLILANPLMYDSNAFKIRL